MLNFFNIQQGPRRLAPCLLLLLASASPFVMANDSASAAPSASAASSSTELCPKSPCQVQINTWQFQRDPVGTSLLPATDGAWQTVQLPHSMQLEAKVIKQQWQGQGFYRKQLHLPTLQPGEQLQLTVQGAMHLSDWFVDGQHIKQQLGGYLPFAVDLTPYAGKSIELLARVDNRDQALIGLKPLNLLDFNFYSGLYRTVELKRTAASFITDPLRENRPDSGIRVEYPQLSPTKAVIAIQTEIGSAEARELTLVQQLFRAEQLVATETSSVTSQGAANQVWHDTVKQQLTVPNPALWSPRSPSLYRLVSSLYRGAADARVLVDKSEQRLGLRQIRFTAKHQLELNGEPLFLRGVNRHQEFPYIGYASSPAADYRDAVRIKAAGFDYVRLSHYPQSDAFMDAADELGLFLLDAIPGWQYQSLDPAFQARMQQTCRELIRRSRNRPSVLAYECSLNETPMSDTLVQALHQTVKQEAPSAWSAGWMPGFDLYLQARQHRLQHYVTPTQPYIVSEYGDWEYYAQDAGFKQDAWQQLKPEARTSRQLLGSGEARLLQQSTNLIEAMQDNRTTPAIADGYWVMFDYNRGYAPDLEASGLMSIDRLPKYSFYQFQSQRPASEQSPLYPSGPMVFIASDWRHDSSLSVRVFSNTEQVSLRLNGKLIQTQPTELDAHGVRLPLTFKVPTFEAGTLEAVGFERQGDHWQAVARHQVRTPEAVAKLRLTLDATGPAPQANDQIFVYASLTDAHGTVVPVNDVPLTVTIEGDLRLLNQPDGLVSERGTVGLLLQTGVAGSHGRVVVSTPCQAAPTPNQAPVPCLKASWTWSQPLNSKG